VLEQQLREREKLLPKEQAHSVPIDGVAPDLYQALAALGKT
jgi:hypothetical protein